MKWFSKRDIYSLIHPPTFLGAVLLAFVGMSYFGYVVGNQNFYHRFVRWHEGINPQSYFYLTARQMIAIAKSRCKKDQILVLVGGNSILFGGGQAERDVWTNHLQELLGEKYCVINFGLRGARFSEGTANILDSLSHDFKVIYLTNEVDYGYEQILRVWKKLNIEEPYVYLFYDAYYKGLLPEDKKDEFFKIAYFHNLKKERLEEIKYGMWLDSLFYGFDAWGYVGYQYFFPVWTSLTKGFKPRSQTTDRLEWPLAPVDQRFKNEMDHHLSVIKEQLDPLFEQSLTQEWIPAEKGWEKFRMVSELAVSKNLRQQTLALVTDYDPYFWDYLPSSYKERSMRSRLFAVKMLQKLGYHAMRIGEDFMVEDFKDTMHFSPSGGRKMAEKVAPEIKQMAYDLGYERTNDAMD